jgi:hypothetical protein
VVKPDGCFRGGWRRLRLCSLKARAQNVPDTPGIMSE